MQEESVVLQKIKICLQSTSQSYCAINVFTWIISFISYLNNFLISFSHLRHELFTLIDSDPLAELNSNERILSLKHSPTQE